LRGQLAWLLRPPSELVILLAFFSRRCAAQSEFYAA
jgi:hypothetical protein